jgi:hypothetical protein
MPSPRDPVTLSPYVTSAIPEPATWAMMLINFAGLGIVASRKKQAQPLTLAA